MRDIIPIDKAGRVVLPKSVRRELAIEAGDVFELSVRGSEITLRPKKRRGGLIRKGKGFVFSSPGARLDREVVERVIAEVREERIVTALGHESKRPA